MAPVNKCLKGAFVAYNSIFLCLYAIGIFAALSGHGAQSKLQTFLGGGIAISVISLGISGVYKTRKWALIVYSVVASIGVVIYFIAGIVLVANRSEIIDELRKNNLPESAYDVAVGMTFGMAVIAFLGVAMAVPLLRQMSEWEDPNAA